MYELNRVLLQSIGPKGARYEDVLLDYRDRDNVPARGSVMFLENGGGKSVLLKLAFSVLLPGRKNVVGATSNTKTLENFVLSGDTGHVVLEWRRVGADGQALSELLLTGKVYEWRSRQHSSDSSNLREAWYTLRPTHGALTLETLPTRTERDGSLHKTPFTAYKEQLEAAHTAHPELDLNWTTTQRQWTAHLDSLGLDPELFRYQREMNADEGDADELFAFRSHGAFVDFLLNAVTDRTGPTELATNVDQFADKLREREQLELEWMFLEGVLERLQPLALAVQDRDGARRELQDAHRRGVDAYMQFAATDAQAAAEQEALEELVVQETERAQNRLTRARELQALLQELRRRAAEFRLADAQAAYDEADREYAETQIEVASWRAVEPVAALRAAVADVRTLARELADAEREAAPLLARRRNTARQLAGTLLALADQAREAARAQETEAAKRTEGAITAEAAVGDARGRAATQRAQAREAQTRLDELEAERVRLVSKKLLARGQSAEDALGALDVREREAERCEREAEERITAIDELVQQLATAAADAKLDEQVATDRAEKLSTERDGLHARAVALSGDERLRELLGVERIELWKMREALQETLTEALAKSERNQVLLELEAADDRRATHALEETGRLPTTRDAEVAIDVLRAAQISATSGWDYLAESVPPAERDTVLRRLPELVGGVVLHNPAHRERAEAALAEAALTPTTIVAVGDTAELAGARSDGRERVVVPPNAALYDEIAGDDEHELRKHRLADVAARRRELQEAYRHDQDLSTELAKLLSDCPAGRLDELAAQATAQRHLVTQAHERLQAAALERAGLLQERPDRVEAAKAAQKELRAVESARPQLSAFAERGVKQRELREAARDRAAAAKVADNEALAQAALAQEHRVAATAAGRLADHERGRAGRLRDELALVEGAGDNVAHELAETSLEELRSAYELATKIATEATTGSDVAAEHRRAEAREADIRAQVDELEADVLARAEALLAVATDRTARREGLARAEHGNAMAIEVRSERKAVRTQMDQQLRDATPRDESGRGPRAQLTDELIPRDLDHAHALTDQLNKELAEANDDARTAGDAADQADKRATDAGARASLFSMSATGIAAALASAGSEFDPEVAAAGSPFTGTDAEARELLQGLTQQLRDADVKLEQAETRTRELVDDVSRYAVDGDFEAMKGSPLRERLVRDEPAAIAGRAGELVPHVEARAREIEKELASIEKHRQLLIERLAGLVEAALSTLRQTGRASRLPGELGDWSGKTFLRIDFQAPENEDVLLERLRKVLDSAVGEKQDRDGMTLLLRGVRTAAEPRGFNVTILKPDTVLRDERVPVPAMAEFSGGQRLTAAIALYCTLAAMRSHSRGRKQQRAGVLFLDNPIGTASAEYLLDIQLKVAERVGVQLVYTTGVYDLNALSKFPCVLRLRNDLDMRVGMSHIRVTDDLRRVLTNGRRLDDPAGYVDAARVIHDRSDEPAHQ